MQMRRRFKQKLTLQDRLAAWSKEVQEQAAKLPPGPERDALIKKARQADVANHLEDWAKSPGLRPPR
jgi:leucyl aminopeptidase